MLSYDPWGVYTAAKWVSVPVAGTDMDKINVAAFYLLGSRIQPLLTIRAGMPVSSLITLLADADEFLELFLNVTKGPKLEDSRPLAEELRKTLERFTILPPFVTKMGMSLPLGQVVNEAEAAAITRLVKAFEAVFCSEMPTKGIFYVSPKRAYATDKLLQSAEASLSEEDSSSYLSGLALENIQEAGRCLVFDRYTAVGFHILRAVEDVARRYYELITDRDAKTITSTLECKSQIAVAASTASSSFNANARPLVSLLFMPFKSDCVSGGNSSS